MTRVLRATGSQDGLFVATVVLAIAGCHRGVAPALPTASPPPARPPFRAPNCNAHAERFVRSVKEECLDRLIPLGERHLRGALAEYLVHYHRERNIRGSATN
jgi:hypothetical protein